MSNAKHLTHAAIGAVSILVIGVVLGVLLDRVALHPRTSAADHPSAALALDASHEGFLQALSDDLGLTAEQAIQVHEILSRHQAAVNDAWSAVHPLLEAAIDSVTKEIEAILEPGQRERLHVWLMERHGAPVSQGVGEGH
jgi:hypothetical protein